MALQSKRHTTVFLCNLIFVVLLPLTSFAQISKDTLVTDEVVVVANRLQNFSAGSKIQNIDSSTLAQYKSANLSDVLNNESGIFIKSYGMGSMATSSVRGAGASQTITLWNGFNLNSPMNGMLDLALIPLGFSNSVSVQYGGAGALWGSGAMGGAIHLNFVPKFNQGTNVSADFTVGSFSNYSQQVALSISKKKVISSLRFFNSSAKNYFPFYNNFLLDNPLVKQSNAERKSNGVLSENAVLLGKHKLNLIFWYQINDRNIPPSMVQNVASDNQKDESYRLSSEWQYQQGRWIYFVRSAFFDERFNYNGLHSKSSTLIAESETKYCVKNQCLNIGLNNTYAAAKADNYANNPYQNRTALFVSYKIAALKNKLLFTASVREELMNGKALPFTYSAGSDVKINKWLSAKVSFSKLYRVATLNDLYWVPGGNLNLKSEEGFSQDLSLKLHIDRKNKMALSIDATLFNRNTTNQIVWLPSSGFWTPQNMVDVWSRGVETSSKFKVQCSKLKIQFSLLTNYVLATNEASKSENDASVGKQLIYVPRYSGQAKIQAEYKGFLLSYTHSYTGYRFTSTDNSQYLSPFYVANVYLAKSMKFKEHQLSFFLQIDNLFNTQYQVLSVRAMPMRYYQFGCSIKLIKPNKSKSKNENS